MSEYSDSYHLKGISLTEAKQFLIKVGFYAMVIPEENNFVCFLVEEKEEKIEESVHKYNPGILLHYVYAADHGLNFRIIHKQEEILSLSIDLEGRFFSQKDPDFVGPCLYKLGLIDEQSISSFYEFLQSPVYQNHESILKHKKERLVQLLGLQHVDWLSCKDLAYQTQEELIKRFPNAIFINQKKKGWKETKSKDSVQGNLWCPQEGWPEFMYLPVPEISLSKEQEAQVMTHQAYWLLDQD